MTAESDILGQDDALPDSTVSWKESIVAWKNRTNFWQVSVKIAEILTNLANIGILAHIIIIAVPAYLTIAAMVKCAYVFGKFTTIANTVTPISDPIIYAFKAINRSIRYIGNAKNTENAEFKFIEQKYGVHPWEDKANVATFILFAIAIAAFCIPPALFPLQSFVAWIAGLSGVAINLYFDEVYPAKMARETYYKKLNYADAVQLESINDDYKKHYYESRFYILILIGLALVLPFVGLLQAYTLPILAHTILNTIATAGSTLVVALNVLRFSNFVSCNQLYKRLPGLKKTEIEAAPATPTSPELSPTQNRSPLADEKKVNYTFLKNRKSSEPLNKQPAAMTKPRSNSIP